jgi:hypothetical protein
VAPARRVLPHGPLFASGCRPWLTAGRLLLLLLLLLLLRLPLLRLLLRLLLLDHHEVHELLLLRGRLLLRGQLRLLLRGQLRLLLLRLLCRLLRLLLPNGCRGQSHLHCTVHGGWHGGLHLVLQPEMLNDKHRTLRKCKTQNRSSSG